MISFTWLFTTTSDKTVWGFDSTSNFIKSSWWSVWKFCAHDQLNIDDVTGENNVGHRPNWSEVPDHPYVIVIIDGSETIKINGIISPINYQAIDKICWYAKKPYEAKY